MRLRPLLYIHDVVYGNCYRAMMYEIIDEFNKIKYQIRLSLSLSL